MYFIYFFVKPKNYNILVEIYCKRNINIDLCIIN